MDKESLNWNHVGIGALLVIFAILVGSQLVRVVPVPGLEKITERVVPVNQYVGGGDSPVIVQNSEEQFGAGSGVRTINNTLRVGSSGAYIGSIPFATGTRDFASIPATNNVTGLPTSTHMTVTGADTNDPCFISLDPAWTFSNFGTANSTSTLFWTCAVVSANTVEVTVGNSSTSTAKDLPSGQLGVMVFDIN